MGETVQQTVPEKTPTNTATMRRKRYLQVSCCSGERIFDPRPLLLRMRALLLRAGSAGCRRAGHRAHVQLHRRSTSLHASGPRSCAVGFDHDSHDAGSHRAVLCGEVEGRQALRHGCGARCTPHSQLTHLLQVRILPVGTGLKSLSATIA